MVECPASNVVNILFLGKGREERKKRPTITLETVAATTEATETVAETTEVTINQHKEQENMESCKENTENETSSNKTLSA